jgi:hypothetical protein
MGGPIHLELLTDLFNKILQKRHYAVLRHAAKGVIRRQIAA